MLQRTLNIGATALIIFSFTVISGGQRTGSPADTLREILSSAEFRGAEAMSFRCEMTAYCPGSCCNTELQRNGDGRSTEVDWSNRIAAGNMTIDQLHAAGIGIMAVDRTKIPYGSIISYDGKLYAALDCGSMIRGNRIDLSCATHGEADAFGRRPDQTVTVWVPGDPGAAVRTILERCR